MFIRHRHNPPEPDIVRPEQATFPPGHGAWMNSERTSQSAHGQAEPQPVLRD